MGFNGDLYPSNASIVMTTKGDMVDYDTERQRLGIGSTGQVLTVASSLPAWSASATSVLSTTGDLLYASGANTLARLAGGTSGDVLTANGAGVAPSYQTPAGGSVWSQLGTTSVVTTVGSYTEVLVSGLTALFTDYSEIVGIAHFQTGWNSAGWRINGVSSGSAYDYYSNNNYGGSITAQSTTGQDMMTMFRYNIAPSSGAFMVGHFMRNENYNDYIQCVTHSMGSVGMTTAGGILKQDIDTLTSLSVCGESESIPAGELTVYGVTQT